MTKRRKPLKRKKPLFSHHKHSGKHLAHHHTHYLPLLFLVVITGFLLSGISRTARAADLTVHAKVSAPLPTVPAIITSPLPGGIFETIPITINGTCPANYLVKIYRNDFFSGSVICATDATFTLSSDLFTGSNELTSHVYNITDDEGPSAPSVIVQYTPPPVATPDASEPTSSDEPISSADVPQLVLKAGNTYQGYMVGDKIDWELEISGGAGPYAFAVDWGDNKSDVISRKKAGKFKISHEYNAPGGQSGSYNIQIKGSDQSDQEVFMQLVVLVSSPSGISSISPNLPFGSATAFHSLQTNTVIWGSYFGVLVGVAGFWVGGLWQTHQLATQAVLRKRIGRRL